MIVTAEDVQTTEQAFESPTDEIADLLIGDETDEETTKSDESDDEETLSDDSTEEEEVNESDEESTEENTDESTDDTWGSVLGVSEDALAFDEKGNVAGVNVKVNGKLDTVPLADLIKDYQGGKSYTEKSQTLATERKEFDELRSTTVTEYSQKLENVELITNYLSNKLVSEFEGINWDQLRVENPAEYAAARQDYSARAQELKQAQDAVAEDKQLQATASDEKTQAMRAEYMQQQFGVLIENNPEWADEESRAAGLTGLKSFLSNQYGVTDTEFNSITDARFFELVKDAKSYREGVKVATTKLKKPVPKFQKSAGKTRKKVSKLDKLTNAARTAVGSRKRDLQTDAVAELLTGI